MTLLSIGTAASLAACSLGPNDLPQPGSSIGNGYDLTIDFASALNLPGDANVTLNGLRVGQVESVSTTGSAVKVTVRIENGTEIPTTATAEIRQDTLLGDTYIALDQGSSSAQAVNLSAGGSIPIDQTTSPPQLEDTLAVLATFVNGGNIQKLENTIHRVNTVIPNMNDLRGLAATTAKDLQNLSVNTDSIDRLLAGLSNVGPAISNHTDVINHMLSPQGMVYWQHLPKDILAYIGTLLPAVGSIFSGGLWMVPMLESVAKTTGVGREVGLDIWNDGDRLTAFLRNVIVPFTQHPSMDVTSVTTPNGEQLSDMTNILRMLGAAR